MYEENDLEMWGMAYMCGKCITYLANGLDMWETA